MEPLLTAVRTSYRASSKDDNVELVQVSTSSRKVSEPASSVSTPAEALEILRTEPDYDTLVATLHFIRRETSTFDIHSPSPLAAQIIHVLASSVLPNYWDIIRDSDAANRPIGTKKKRVAEDRNQDLLLSCLQSISGLKAILLQLKVQIQRSRTASKNVGGPACQDILKVLLEVLTVLLHGDGTIQAIYIHTLDSSQTEVKQQALWNELLGLVGGGKIVGIAAEAENILCTLSKGFGESYWIANGFLYSSWLARNIIYWAKKLSVDPESSWNRCCELLNKSLRLGYTEIIVKELVASLLLQQKSLSFQILKLLDGLPSSEQKRVVHCLLKILADDYLSGTSTVENGSQWWVEDATTISAAAGLIDFVVAGNESRRTVLLNWLANTSGAGFGNGIAVRRAVLAALASSNEDMEMVLERSLQQCGDPLYIRHTPSLQQEVHVQVLLLAAGYVFRKSPLRFSRILRSGAHLSVVSNRLAASSPRAQFLGMVVGEALSNLADEGDKRMDFKMNEMKTDEAKWYKGLVVVSDNIGSTSSLKLDEAVKQPKQSPAQSQNRNVSSKPNSRALGIIAIEELEDGVEEDEGDEDDDGLTLYAKPDSDAEDSDDDPTLVTRNKPTAPVYIRDLITYLRDTENYDRQKLALANCALLIRRKANFGTEVSSHSEELASLLVGLQDKYEIENFQDMRIQGMIAVLVALPVKMGQWFSKTLFDGDYSISQRAAILTTLGVGARELGGFGAEDENLTSMKGLSFPSSFPSKRLPKHMETRLGLSPPEPTQVDKLAKQLSHIMITPIAADLADKRTGPSLLKVRTFSSRMEVEKKRKKPVTNALAKIVADSFFFPLTGRFFIHLRAYGSSRANIAFEPYLLALFIKTLSLLIHASGPSNLSLPQMTSEFWDLLLGLRVQGVGDITILEALLFAFLTILDINEDKRSLVETHGRQMLETQEWVQAVFERMGAGQEDEKTRLLAAACLVRIREVVEKYQTLLMGDLSSY